MNTLETESSKLIRLGDRFKGPFTVLALLIVLLGIGFAFGRVYKDYSPQRIEGFNWDKRGLSDFHNCYMYSKTFRYGLSPYEVQEREDLKASRPSAPFSPVIFYLLLPLTFLSMTCADIVFCVVNVALLGLLGYWVFRFSNESLSLHWWLAVFGFILFSRSGHITLYTGYFTAIIVVGTIMAFHYAHSKPWLSGIGILLASAKPTFIIPLLILLAYRKNYKAAIWGTLLSGSVAFAGLAWMAADSSIPEVINSVFEGQKAFDDDPTEYPINTWTRVDLVGMFAKAINWIPDNQVYLGAMFVLLIPPGLIIRRAVDHERNRGAMGLTALISMLGLLVMLYHHSYDCLLVVPGVLSLALFGHKTMVEVPKWARLVVTALLLVPPVNYLSTMSFRDKMGLEQYSFNWQSITMINGFCLTISLLILMYYAWKLATLKAPMADESLA